MANLDFPTSPTNGQIYSANGKTWRFDGVSWKSFNTLGIASGGTGLTSILAANAFLSSDSAGTALTYRIFRVGTGMTLTVDANSVLFTSTGGGGSGTVHYGSLNTLAFYQSAGFAVTGAEGLTFDSTAISLTANKFIGNLSATAATADNFYGSLIGTASTSNYSHVSGYGITSGLAIRASTVDIDQAFEDNTFTLVFFKGMHGTGIALSSNNTLYYNPSADVLTAPSFSGNLSGTAITASSGFYGNLIGTATTSSNSIVQNGTESTDHYLIFGKTSFAPSSTSGIALSVNQNIKYQPNNNILTVGQIAANVSGSAITASSSFYGNLSGTSTTSTNVNITDSSSSTTNYLLFTPNSGSQSGGAISSNSNITLNPGTKTLSLSDGELTVDGIRLGNSTGKIDTTSGNLTLDSAGGTVNLNDNLIVQGNLTVQGTTTTVDSTVTSIVDPVIVLGSGAGNTHSTTDDNKDRGIEFRYAESGTAITGFFGYKDDKKFYYIPNATLSSENVYTGTAGTIVANLEGNSTTASSAAKWTTARTVTFSGGDVTGNFTIDGSADVSSVNLTIANNSVALGTDTTGQYASSISINGLGITATQANGDDGTSYIIYSSASSSNGSSTIVIRDINGGFAAGIVTANEFLGNISGSAATFTNFYGNLVGTATTAQNILLQSASSNDPHKIIFSIDNNQAGNALSYNSTLVYNPGTDTLITSGMLITSTTKSTSYGTGALVVYGGIGVSDGLYTSTSSLSSISGVAISNSIISSGTWSGSVITSLYGGTGTGIYAKGDLLIGDLNGILSRFPIDGDGSVLIGSSYSGYGVSWQPLLTPTYGAFASTTTQSVTASGSTVIHFNTTYESNRVTITPTAGDGNTTRIYILDTGTYNLHYSLQNNLLTTNQPRQGDFYFRLNGVDVPLSNTRITVAGSAEETVLSANITKTIVGGSYLELVMQSSTSDFAISTFNGLTTPTRPDIPSAIVSVYPVASVLPGGGAGVSGLASLNNETGSIQTFATGNAGVDFNIVSLNNVHTFNIPNAGITTDRGLITNATQTIAGAKTFTNILSITDFTQSTSPTTGSLVNYGGLGVSGSASIGGSLLLFNTDQTNYVGFVVGSLTGSTVYVLPTKTPQSSSGTSVLSSTIDGIMSWVPMTATGPGGSGTVDDGNIYEVPYYYSGTAITGSSGLINLAGSGITITYTADSASQTTGALVVTGGVGIGGSLQIGNRLTINTGNLFTQFVGNQSGISTVYRLPSTTPQSSSGTSVLSSTTDGVMSWVPMTAASPGGSGTVNSGNIYEVPYYYAGTAITGSSGLINLAGSGVTITYTADSISKTTGALVVTGGVGIGGSVSLGNRLSLYNASNYITFLYSGTADTIYTLPSNSPQGTGNSVLTATMNGVMSWQPLVASSPGGSGTVDSGNIYEIPYYYAGTAITGSSNFINLVGSGITITYTADSISKTTGALVVSGGVGIGGSVSLGNRLSLYNASNYLTFLYSGTANTVYTLPATTPQSSSGTSVLSSTIDGLMSWVPMTAGSPGGSGTVGSGAANKLAYYSTAGTAVTDTYGMNYNLSGTASTFTIFGGASLGNTAFIVQAISSTSVRVGIGITNPQYALEVEGEISATSKSFVIDHPTKPGMKLRYGSLEGPENGVYVRGILTNEYIIETPDYWKGLVDPSTFTVNLTPIGNYQRIFVEKVDDYKVYVGTAETYINCYYSVIAERKDVPKLEVEY